MPAKSQQHTNATSFAYIILLGVLTFLALWSSILSLLYVIDAHDDARSIAFRASRALSRTSAVYRDLGITCPPHNCDNEDILRNITQLSANELEIAISLIDIVNDLRLQSKTLSQDSVLIFGNPSN